MSEQTQVLSMSSNAANVDVTVGTEYVVLERQSASPEEVWKVVKTTTARTPENAIKAIVNGGDGGVYAAVPSRSWTPFKVSEKVEKRLVLEAAL